MLPGLHKQSFSCGLRLYMSASSQFDKPSDFQLLEIASLVKSVSESVESVSEELGRRRGCFQVNS
jgi:hypothetical protein